MGRKKITGIHDFLCHFRVVGTCVFLIRPHPTKMYFTQPSQTFSRKEKAKEEVEKQFILSEEKSSSLRNI